MMSNIKKKLGTSVISLVLVIWGLFMVCSGRVPELQYEDDLFSETGDFSSNGEESELMSQLAALDGEDGGNLEDFQRREILEALGIDPGETAGAANKEDDFLSEELFLDLEVQVGELEKMSKSRNDQLDSLRKEIEEADHQLAALGKVVDPSAGTQLASRTIDSPPRANRGQLFSSGPKSDYQIYYEEALEDIYAHRYPQAIAKFQDLLRQPDTDDLADNCQYWVGEAYFAMGKFDMAIAEFEKVFVYDNNNKIDDAQFMIGMSYAKLGNANLAKLELMNLMSFFQNSEYIPRAENQISDLRI